MKSEEIFRVVTSYCLLALGLLFVLYDAFLSPPVGAGLVFGLQLLAAAYYVAHGEFDGFKSQ